MVVSVNELHSSFLAASTDGLFQIDPATGVITVQSELDREEHLASNGVITLEIEVQYLPQVSFFYNIFDGYDFPATSM